MQGNPSFGVEEHDDVKDLITILSLSVVLSFVVDLRGSPSGGSGAFILLHKHTIQVGEFGVCLTMPRCLAFWYVRLTTRGVGNPCQAVQHKAQTAIFFGSGP